MQYYLALRSYTLTKKKKKNNSQVNGAQTVQFLTLNRCISSRADINKKEKPKLVKKTKLLAKIKTLIFEQKVEQN